MRHPIRYTMLLFMLPLLNYSCQKNNKQSPASLSGTWELRQTSGGWAPGYTTYTAGNGNILDFTGTQYKIYKSGQVIKSGQFTVVYDPTASTSVCLVLPKGEYNNRLIYDADSTTAKIVFQIAGNKLTFYSGCYAVDAGHSEVYERVKSAGTGH